MMINYIGCRTCKMHLNDNKTFSSEALSCLATISNTTTLTGNEILTIFENLRQTISSDLFFEFKKMSKFSDEKCKMYTGLTTKQFSSLEKKLKSLKNSPQRTKSQALATYLFWLKSGLPHRAIANLFNLDHHQTVGEYCEQTRNAMLKDFVTKHLGANHIKRSEWLTHNTQIAKNLYDMNDDQLAIISDGTYLYCQKSTNNTFQKKSWSVQKNASLVKPFVICATDGYIVDIFGPYPAVDNDAKILKKILQTDKDLRKLLQANDHLILDRGFRDSIDELETIYRFKTHMPSFKPTNQNQLKTIEANRSRFVTKCRWTVEAINGLLKTMFRANDKVVDNKSLYHSIDDFRIAASIINKYHKRLLSDKDNQTLISNNMKEMLNKTNKLEPHIKMLNRKKKVFIEMPLDSVKDFPKLNITDIRDHITLGSYQLKQCLTYLNNLSSIERYTGKAIIDPNQSLIRTQIKSRHSNSKTYNTYIAYKPNVNSPKAIDSWFCTCKAGTRTVGTCSHIATVIYKLSLKDEKSKTRTIKSLESIFPSLPIYESTDTEEECINPEDISEDTHTRIYPELSFEPELYPNTGRVSTSGVGTSGVGTSGVGTSGVTSFKTTTIEIVYPELDSD